MADTIKVHHFFDGKYNMVRGGGQVAGSLEDLAAKLGVSVDDLELFIDPTEWERERDRRNRRPHQYAEPGWPY